MVRESAVEYMNSYIIAPIADDSTESGESGLEYDISSFVNHSGGANGADSYWDDIGREFGMTTNRHYWTGETTPRGNVEIPVDSPDIEEGR